MRDFGDFFGIAERSKIVILKAYAQIDSLKHTRIYEIPTSDESVRDSNWCVELTIKGATSLLC